ncbi:Beta-chimaerin [Penicillium subrubescens]|uniref:Beta-chimaerin n=1 Tax=Penicillium subrubescens TaxID=1316194 RepID=A0A1Q5UJN4_9EURO|nr:Beta-chimaerin [Penicillium subrubescens]
MESPAIHPESPMEQDEVPFPCMGCGERWHIDCFRCSTCGTLLDSDAHLLLLGDGSLICSSCTYSCNSCGNKIEDLAILTGDQAFCAQCFRCRNCKKKIENLRYARTSQGIFCMDCHESLMQRRRKKKASAVGKRPGGPGIKLDKSLPSLPPSMEETRSIDEAASETYAEVPEPSHGRSDGHGDHSRTESSPTRQPAATDNLILPSSTYRSSRQLGGPRDNDADGGGEFLIPLTFDPSEALRSSSNAQSQQELPRDYFGQMGSGDSSLRTSRDGRDYTLEPPSRASSEQPSPHIAYQEKGREARETESSRRDMDSRNGWPEKPSTSQSERARLGMSESARSSRSDLPLALRETSAFSGATSPESSRSKEATGLDGMTPGSARPSTELRRPHEHATGDSTRSQPTNMAYPPKRGDSLEGKHHIPRKEVSSPASSAYGGSPRLPDSITEQHKQNMTSVNTTMDGAGSPSQTRYNGSEFSPDDEQNSESFLRRMSNSVRHGRSFSDKSIRLGKDGKYPRSPANGSSIGTDIGSPTASTAQAEEISWLRNELRKERLRVSELEAAVRATADVKQVNTELSEKRSTMVVLDAQREIVLRELTVLTDHLEAEKRGAAGGPLDLGKLSNRVLRELAESIHKLKETYTPQIEELIQQRNDLTEELANLNRQKEKTFSEFEQLSSKNAQLAELNNTLVHQIQELYKNSSDGPRGPNGLGIVSHSKDRSIGSLETLKPTIDSLGPSISTAHISDDMETQTATATIVPGPQVVNLRKGKFMNWKKGGQNVAKGVKGLKGAFMSSENAEGGGGLPRSQTQDPSRQGFGFFGNQRSKQGGKMSQADSVPVLTEVVGGGLFGTDLEARMEHEKSIIPAIVTRCIQEVELRGMDMEGIYRKSGAASAIQGIRDGFERSPFDYDISDPDLDIHAVTSALKQYFRKLPMPLITYDIYDKIIDSAEITHTPARVELLVKHLSELPRVHRDVLEFLVFHLKRVVERQDENLMTSQNIAVVFAPTIMRPESLAREMTDVQKKNDILKFLVENCQDVFMGMQN